MFDDDAAEFEGTTDIAIVGMSARVPGARNFAEYWKNLEAGVESIRSYTDEELLAAGESPEALRHKNYVRAAAPLPDMELFDGEFFGFSPKESAIMDPQHRHFLEACWEALETAGHPPDKFEGPIGVWAGCGMGSYFYFNLCTNPELVRNVGMFLLRHTGNDKDFLATRVSYLFDLQGPSIGVQTACSTSLVAVHMACASLLNQEVDMALAGGVTIELPHRRGYIFAEGEILSPDGHCHAFDHRAQGTVFGSGAGAVVLRRLDDAIRDGDPIFAVIKGSAINNDGSGKVNYLAPSVDGQARCMVEAYGISGVSPDTVDYVECHGTGTYLGDPIEIAALTQAYRQETKRVGYCRIGSVKTNIGHLDTAAGVASLIKASLAVHHGKMPPSLGFEKPNPTIDFGTSPFVVNDRLTDWPKTDHPRRAAVNSLGVGGTNAHIVIEEAPAPPQSSDAKRRYQLIAVSGRNGGALDGNTARLVEYLRSPEGAAEKLADIAFTLHAGRKDFLKRRVVAARDHAEAARLLAEADPRRVFTQTATERASVVFLLPGGGAQYARMGADLYEHEPVFKEHVERGLKLLQSKHGIDLSPLLFADPAALDEANAALEPMPHQLPAIFIIEYALAQLWMSWGVKPDALLGHSLGENTAACLAGVLSYEDALGLVTLRGKLFAKVPGGAMLSVALPRAELDKLLPSDVDVAVINVPDVTVVSGPEASIDALETQLKEREIESARLAIPVAAHSRMLAPILEEFRAYLRSIELSPPQTPFLSNGSGTWITDEEATSPDYWVAHLRGTVNFDACLTTVLGEGERVMIEVGPGRTLSSLSRQHPAGGPSLNTFSSLRHKDEQVPDDAFFTAMLGRAWAAGASFDWAQLWKDEKRRRVVMPTYAFQHQHFFIEAGKVELREEDVRDLPKLEDLERWGYRPAWQPALPSAAQSGSKHTWLLFMDTAGVGMRLRDLLQARGDKVVSVYEGDAFSAASDTEYVVAPERGREGYAALLRALVEHGHTPDRVAHLWLLTEDESHRPGSSFFHRNQERGFYSLFFLAQAIADEGLPTPLHITMVGNGMQSIDGEPLPYPAKATVLGPVRVVPRELAGVTCSSVDVQLPEHSRAPFGGRLRMALVDPFAGKKARTNELDQLSADLYAELVQAPRNAVVALRPSRRFEETWAPAALRQPASTDALREGAVVLVTGGLGGLGLLFAEHLAKTKKAKLALVARNELPPRDEWDHWLRTYGPEERTSVRISKVRALEEAGAEVVVVPGDVTIESDMAEVVDAVKARFGAIHCVLHTAGVVNDALIQVKSQADCEDVFTPKIHGTLVLDRVLAKEPLELFVLFSSTSSVTGNAGQVDYAAANAFLNAFATSRAQQGRAVRALAWGIWNDVGMAHEAISKRERGAVEVVGEAREPLLDARIKDSTGRRAFVGRWHCGTHWVLDGHRTLAGHAVLPGTGFLELAREALREQGEEGPFEIQDLFFIRPLHVGDEELREVRVFLDRTQTGYALEVRSRYEDGGRVGWELHAQCSLSLAPLRTPARIRASEIEARCDARHQADAAGVVSPQEKFMRFGPRWRVVREIHWGKGEAIATLALDDRFAAETERFALHPALLDLATGFAMDLIEGYDASSLWVPMSYERVRVHAPLTPRLRSHVKLVGAASQAGELATFDVTLLDPEGRVLVEVHRFSIKKTDASADFSVRSRPAPTELQWEERADRELSPAEAQLQRNLERGILPAEGTDAFDRALHAQDSAPVTAITSLALPKLIRQSELSVLSATSNEDGQKFARPNLDSEYVEARDEVEKTLVGFWQELLGVDMIGVKDSFFDLGGHSLIAVRLFAKIKKTWQVEFPISVLFEAPTIERCAELIKDKIGVTDASAAAEGEAPKARTRYTHLVAMHPGEGGPKTPFFLVAGMFGNVLNLRHLAHLIGADRRFYGLQARGLYGDQKPHETFEEMAQAYIAEMRTVQPHGPYLLGGFSGGGITAYEIALQLMAAGEEIDMLLFLDTPLPHRPPLTRADRALLQLVQLQKKGPAYVAEWAQKRYAWEVDRLRKRFDEPEPDKRADAFRSEDIEASFRAALDRYTLQRYPGKVTLYRPKIQDVWVIGPGRMVDKDRHYVHPDNGWTPHVDELEIFEVPGDHDSMVLEPNVRVLARRLRRSIDQLEKTRSERTSAAATPPKNSPARRALDDALSGDAEE